MPNLRMLFQNYSIFNCYSSRATPGISFFRITTKNDDKIKPEEQHCYSYYSCIDGDVKRQIKNQTLHTSRLFLLTKIFQYTNNWPKASWVFELLPTLLFNTHWVGNKFYYAGLYIKRTNVSLFLIRDSVILFNIESANKKPPVINVAFFIWYNFLQGSHSILKLKIEENRGEIL